MLIRRTARVLGFVVLAISLDAQRTTEAPRLTFSSPQEQAVLGAAYDNALASVLNINTVPYDPARYNRSGLLTDPPGTFLRAGGGYEQPWTRDASVNSWNAASLLEPQVARNTLWSVVQRQSDGKLIVQQDNQWWDQVIWIIAAWNHYAVTGDTAFLKDAYETATEALARAKQTRFRATYGLFSGPGFFNDGIAGYPVPPATPTEDHGSFVLDYPHADEVFVLSTNCLYVQAYRSAAAMARAVGDKPEALAFEQLADGLKVSINQHFWIAAKHSYGYLIDRAGTLDDHQEGAGVAFALLFDIAGGRRARDVLRNTHLDPRGIVDVFPSFPRYSETHPGRHNEIVWPMVEGFWAMASSHHRNEQAFAHEVKNLSELASASSGHFYEIYNAQSGVPDGGWQTGKHWESQPDQTWSATAYLAMIFRGLFGMNFTPDGIEFAPLLPSEWGDVTLSEVHYRGMTLDLHLHGAGCAISRFKLDGKRQKRAFVPSSLTGTHEVDIELHGGCR